MNEKQARWMPTGDYVSRIVAAEDIPEFMVVHFLVLRGPRQGWRFFQPYLIPSATEKSLDDRMLFRVRELATACGMLDTFKTGDLVGKTVRVNVIKNFGVRAVLPVGGLQ